MSKLDFWFLPVRLGPFDLERLSCSSDRTAPPLQLLGDYDKVKTSSSGSDCVCRCVVRPMRRADCGQQVSGQDHYTVETISEGCQRCECTAPPTVLNPCEAERRLKRLQEASEDHQQVIDP